LIDAWCLPASVDQLTQEVSHRTAGPADLIRPAGTKIRSVQFPADGIVQQAIREIKRTCPR
jgi:hypothetical protein